MAHLHDSCCDSYDTVYYSAIRRTATTAIQCISENIINHERIEEFNVQNRLNYYCVCRILSTFFRQLCISEHVCTWPINSLLPHSQLIQFNQRHELSH